MPWLYTRALKAAEDGGCILYPVYYDYPLGWELKRVEHDEYIFGGEMLVVPIVTPADPDTRMASADYNYIKIIVHAQSIP